MGIEPTYPAWKAGVLPLNYTRVISDTNDIISYYFYFCKYFLYFFYCYFESECISCYLSVDPTQKSVISIWQNGVYYEFFTIRKVAGVKKASWSFSFQSSQVSSFPWGCNPRGSRRRHASRNVRHHSRGKAFWDEPQIKTGGSWIYPCDPEYDKAVNRLVVCSLLCDLFSVFSPVTENIPKVFWLLSRHVI